MLFVNDKWLTTIMISKILFSIIYGMVICKILNDNDLNI